MSENTDFNSILIAGRGRRVEHLFSLIHEEGGLSSDFYYGKFSRAFPVKDRTFYSYLKMLKLQGRIVMDMEASMKDPGEPPCYWTRDAYVEILAERKAEKDQRERDELRAMAGKMEEYMAAQTTKE